jgi:hypothetical protein
VSLPTSLQFFAALCLIASANSVGADTQTPAVAPSAPSATMSKENVTRDGRKAWRRVLKWPDSCEEGYDYPDPALGGVAFHALAKGRYLAEVVCTLGAYQGYQRYYLLDESAPQPTARPLTFSTYEATGKQGQALTRTQTEELWGSPEFDPKTRRLKVMNRFRGTGDCGTLAVYAFDSGDPQLQEFRAKTACDGRGAGNPGKWPRVKLLKDAQDRG